MSCCGGQFSNEPAFTILSWVEDPFRENTRKMVQIGVLGTFNIQVLSNVVVDPQNALRILMEDATY